jgi:hypothetical protein
MALVRDPSGEFPPTSRRSPNAQFDSLPIIWIIVAPIPVDALLPAVQLHESTPLMVFGLVSLVRTIFITVPSVIVLVTLVVVAPVVLALPVFMVPVVLWEGGGHHRYRSGQGGSQKK